MSVVRTVTARAGELLAALLLAAVVARAVLAVVNRLPFAEPSWLPETVAGTVAVGLVLGVAWLLLRASTGDRTLWAVGVLAPAVFVSTHLSLLLHGTPHYLFGLGGDQANRVTYLGRFADSPALDDAFYADAAPFYPPQWFWVGGRLAALFDVPAWLFYKPYAIVTMAVAGSLAFVAWRLLVGSRIAVVLGLVTAAVGVHLNAYEPYSWILLCLLPQVVAATTVLCTRIRDDAHHRRTARWLDPGSAVLVTTIGLYLGWAALAYTLLAGFAAAVVGVVVVAHAWSARHDRRTAAVLLGALGIVAAISAAIALVFWHRYLFAVLTGAPTEPSVANDFAPESASRWPLPMTEPSVTGALCLIGTVWILATVWPRRPGTALAGAADALAARIDVDDEPTGRHAAPVRDAAPTPSHASVPTGTTLLLARVSGLLAIAVFAWYLLSGIRAVTGHTLLPFRMIPVITLALALAGVIGALALARWAIATSPSHATTRTRAIAVALAVLAGIQLAQHVSEEDVHFAAVARDTAPPPTAVLDAIDTLTGPGSPRGRRLSELVVLSADPALFAYRPYHSFQAPAQAYAPATARYSARLDEVRRWAAAPTARAAADAMDDGPFRAPDVLVLDRATDGTWVFPATVNTMPREGDNVREDIHFTPPTLADPGVFDVRVTDGHVVVARR